MDKAKRLFEKHNITIYKFKLFDIIYIAARIILGIAFLASAASKIPNMQNFQNNVVNYHLVPQSLLFTFSHLLPWIELVIGIYLIIGLFEKITAYVVLALLVMFMFAISYALITNQPVTGCGCFSQAPTERIGWIDDVRDIGFLLLDLIILLKIKRFLSIDLFLKHKGADSVSHQESSAKSQAS